ncbi:MAG TPA: UDP-2,3-diacylglucosamine diphosphatase LpxI [Opitutaceae bacterium]|nr:UDP-2,3-diacylglucosamine diphosphatase LpxI [Opitutaceae bacterium]
MPKNPSAYLPEAFDPKLPVALIAGQGIYPQLAARAMRAAGLPVKLIAFEGETAPELVSSFPEADRHSVHVGQVGKTLRLLEKSGVGYALMAGMVTPRRLFDGLRPDMKAAQILLSLKLRNAETIFGAVAKEIEALGIRLLDARAFLDDQLAAPGCMTGGRFPIDKAYLNHGVHIATECARLDIGQGCVVRKGTVLAVEAFEGTDEMLKRAGGLKSDETLFVKTVKARQDFRFDVPCLGLRTLESMRDAGIHAAALKSMGVIILDKPAVLERARSWGISLLGFE